MAANAARLNTGKKINSALDNPVSFFTALEHTNRARDLMMRKAEMGEGIQTIRAASTGIDSMLEMIDSAEALAKSALSAGSAEERDSLANQYNETLEQITAVANDASYKGVGLLRCPPESMTINFDEAGDSSLTVEGECSSATGLGLNEVENNGKDGPEIQVSSNATNPSLKQDGPFMTSLSDGGYVVAWHSDHTGDSRIYLQRFDSSGNTIGGETQVNTNELQSQNDPSLTEMSDGTLVVVWASSHTGDYGVYGQRFDSNGGFLGSEFKINTTDVNDKLHPRITALTNGNFAVTWSSNQFGDYRIFAQIYDNSLNKIGNEIEVSSNTGNLNYYPKIAELSNDRFIITWTDFDSSQLFGQIFDNLGNKEGSQFGIKSNPPVSDSMHNLTSLSDGGFIEMWHANLVLDFEIYGQRYDGMGNKVGDQFQINTTTNNDQTFPDVTALSNGGFVATWSSNQEGDYNIYAQQYDRLSNPVGEEFQVNTNQADHQGRSSIVELKDGSYIISWLSRDGGQYDMCAQKFLVSNWSSSSNIQTSLDELQAAKERLRTLQQKFSNNLSIITTRSSFTDAMVNTLETGAGNLTNADLNEEGANALMLQTQQSLGMTSLTMASQAAQSVLRLFS